MAPTRFVDRAKAFLRALLIRAGLLLAGAVVVVASIWINFNAGGEILAGLLSRESPGAIVASVARLLVPAVGLWLIYRGLR